MRLVRLDEVIKIQIGKTPSRSVKEYWGVGFPWVSIADLKGQIISKTKEEITQIAIDECGCKLIPKGTLLMSFKLSIGKLAFANMDLYTNEAICGLQIKDKSKIKSEFLYFALRNTNLLGSNVAVMGATLNTASLNSLKIPIPESITDQIKIAQILTKAETLIKQRKQSIALLDEFLKSTFLEIFGDPARNPKNLSFTELEKLCSVIVDCPHSTPVKSKEATNYPCIRTSELTNGYISWGTMQYLDKDEYIKRTQRLIPEAGDIVYGREGTYGEAIRIPTTHRFSLGQRTMLFRPDYKKANSIFLWAMVRSEFVYSQAKRKNSGSTVGHVNVKDIKQFKVYNPPIEIQNHFAKIVEKIESLKSQYQQSLQELEYLFGSLSQKAFKGELDLKRIGDFKFSPVLQSDIEVPARIKFKETIKAEAESSNQEDDYLVKHLGKWLKIKPAKVKFVEANKPYVTIIYENDVKYLVRTSMDSLLKTRSFKDILIRVHQSIAVNKNQIKQIAKSNKTITTIEGIEFPISDTYKNDVYIYFGIKPRENKKKKPIIDLLPKHSKTTNLAFNYNEGKAIVQKYFSKKTGFNFKEFSITIIGLGFTTTFTELKNFIIEALSQKLLLQVYASKEYMQSIPNIQYSSHGGDEFVGDGTIWFVSNPDKK